MKISYLLLAVIFLTVAPIAIHAQFRKIPAEVTNAFHAKFPDSKNVEWKDKITDFEADYQVGDTSFEARFDSDGNWLQTEKDIADSTMPAAVKDGFGKSKYTDWELKTISWIENKSDGIQYRLLVRKNAIEKRFLYFNTSGKLLKDSITL